ncbi:MAG: gdhB 1 [Verrucomicrobiales bacterium]|nr:gdhB 1 [Verrucomicrobiales bacterium]
MKCRLFPTPLVPVMILASLAKPQPLRAVEAEGVTEDHAVAHELKGPERVADTAPVDTADAARRSFSRARILEGFTAGLWATEPLLANPVAFSFDGRGRMYVAETHRYRTSVLDIRHYMFMLEDDMASRNQDDWVKSIKKNFPGDWQKLGIESEVVRLVEDTDGDGWADKSGVYADGFNSILDGIASGVMARPDGVWLTNIPGLYKLSGTGADGRAVKKEEVFRGFGVRFNYTGHDLHGLIKGPDGRIYFSIGDRGASVKTKEGTTLEVPDEGAIFRCEEDGSRLEVVMRGLRNPQEMAFDDHGNLFTCDNDSDQGDRERLVYVVEGGDAGWRVGYQHHPQPAERNPWLAEHMWEPRAEGKHQPARILSPLANLPDGPGGLVHYPGTGLPEKYRGCFFLACYKGSSATSQVAVFRPKPDGASFQLEFLESFIPGCQATDVDFGPDSRLYVSFWDEGWERTAQGRILKVEHAEARAAQATQIAEVQSLLAEGMRGSPVEVLIRLLGHADQRVRLESQWELTDRLLRGESAPAIREELRSVLVDSKERLPRLHAVWALGNFVRVSFHRELERNPAMALPVPDDSGLAALFEDADEEIRTACLNACGGQPVPFSGELSALIREKLKDSSPRVRLAAAQALGKHGDPASTGPLLELARRETGKSQELRHVVSLALIRLAERNAGALRTLEGVIHDRGQDANVRLTVMLAFGQGGVKWANHVADFLIYDEPDFFRETAGLISDRGWETAISGTGATVDQETGKPPVVRQQAMSLLGVYADESDDPMVTLRGLNAFFRTGGLGNSDHLVTRITDPDHPMPSSLAVEALKMMAEWENPPPRDKVTGLYRPLPQGRSREDALRSIQLMTSNVIDSNPAVTVQYLKTLRALGHPSWISSCVHYALGRDNPVQVRVSALRLLPENLDPERSTGLKPLLDDSESMVRITAAGLLGKSEPALAVRSLKTALGKGSAEDDRAVFTALGTLHSSEADELLTDHLTRLASAQVPPGARLELLEAAGKRESAVVREALAKYEAALPKNDPLAAFAVSLEGGNAVEGKRVFREHAVAACMRCHRVENSGGEAGPALDGVGDRLDRRAILESIVEPNAVIAEGFQMAVFTLKDGTAVAGAVKSETSSAFTIQVPGSDAVTVEKARIDRRDPVPSGMMPGLGVLLSKRELRDLVEYCAGLKAGR